MAAQELCSGLQGAEPVLVSGSLVAQTVKNLPAMQRPGFDPWDGKTLWRRGWQPTPVLFPGTSHGQRSLLGYGPWGCKETDRTERLTLWLPSGSRSDEAGPSSVSLVS